ncbi:hypothetical protein pb186bvf_003390 [Paramecium bursaria]
MNNQMMEKLKMIYFFEIQKFILVIKRFQVINLNCFRFQCFQFNEIKTLNFYQYSMPKIDQFFNQ